MRFNLQEIKKSVHRRQGELAVSLHFLQLGELTNEIAQLIAYYETLLGHTQREFSLDEARVLIGDYRLAHCLNATLSNWYVWRQREWTEVVQSLGRLRDESSLSAVTSPIQLRLALYNYVNEHYQGFLDAQMRSQALQAFAETYSLELSDLEYLLILDSEEETRLVRDTSEPPTPQEVATLYNQWAFEAALFNASSVRFIVDCNAFSRATQTATATSGVGAVIKRLCYLARKLGVYYDLSYEPTLDGMPTSLALTLYGPQEMTGTSQQYGMRLARLCRLLMGYGRAKSESGRRTKKPTLANAIIEASATIHFLQRSYSFVMDAHLLQLLPSSDLSQEGEHSSEDYTDAQQHTLFDSSIEQLFAEAFMALARSQGVDGWQLEREPEPLLLDQSIFIPDFAVSRAQQRVYVEILGFWTPSYRERKLQKLQQLMGRADLLLAVPIEARDAFASIASHFPIVYYDGQLSATEVIAVLRSRYDDFAARLEQIDVSAVQARVRSEGLLSEQTCAATLHCYRRSEIQQAVERVTGEDIVFVTGIGLYTAAWMEQVKRNIIPWMRDRRSVRLAEVIQKMGSEIPVLQESEDVTIETILGTWPELQIRRSSIFDATIACADDILDEDGQLNEAQGIPSKRETRVRERPITMRKRSTKEASIVTQEDLWG